MNERGPRMKGTIRLSGERAGWLTESAKFVSCTHSARVTGLLPDRSHNRPAIAATSTPAAIDAYAQARRCGAETVTTAADCPVSIWRCKRFRSAGKSNAV